MSYENDLFIQCSECGLSTEVERWDIRSSSADCDLCGSHGEVEVLTKCKHCGHKIEYIVNEW